MVRRVGTLLLWNSRRWTFQTSTLITQSPSNCADNWRVTAHSAKARLSQFAGTGGQWRIGAQSASAVRACLSLVQSSGGKRTCQKEGLGSAKSTPTLNTPCFTSDVKTTLAS
jgi:hypothetical protein